MKKFVLFSALMLSLSVISISQNTKAFHFTPDTTFLPDGSGVSYTTSILVDGYMAGQTLTINDLISVCVNMEHSYLGDLVFELICPNGDSITLENQGGGGVNLGIPLQGDGDGPGQGYDYCWMPDAEYGVMSVVASSVVTTLPAGSYTPLDSFDNLIGCPINGYWTIRITDNWSIDDGYIFNWGINFASNPGCFTMLTGKVYADMNENGIYDDGDSPLPGKILKAEPGPYYGYTNSDGIYKIWVSQGEYTVTQLGVESPWYQFAPSAPEYYSINVPTDEYDTIPNVDFANAAEFYCPLMNVDVVLGGLGICSYPSVYINYSNSGTIQSENTLVTVEIDENLAYYSGGNLVSQEGNLLTFNVGTVAPGQQGQFHFITHYSCDPDLAGVTACVAAHIYPDDPCGEEISEEWDRSSVMVEGECVDGLQVCFTITNTGDPGEGDMQGTSQYRIYENNVLVHTGTFQIAGGANQEICWPANGNTIRLEADQRPGHPGNSHPQESIELCGSPNNSTGFILDVPQDDVDEFVEIDCQEVLASYDPNDKAVIPAGIFSQHFIDSTDVLEYRIRFQNTGTAPAINIYILDTISERLDITTFRQMSSSHPCTIDILPGNVIRWYFTDIMLPDSTHNEPESHGYVKFKINQAPGNDFMDVIYNSAGIFFDYNLPVLTNTVFNTIGKDSDIISVTPISKSGTSVDVYPNPAGNTVYFDSEESNITIEIYNLSGQKVKVKSATNGYTALSVEELSNGLYFYNVTGQHGLIGSGKLMIEK